MKMEEKDFEPAGLIPRSIIRTVERFQQQLRPETIALGIQEFRISRYQVRVSVRYFFILLLLPISLNWGAKNLFIKPLVGYFWNTHRTSLFLNNYQAGRAFQEMRDFESQLFFEMLLSTPENSSHLNNIISNNESSLLSLTPETWVNNYEQESQIYDPNSNFQITKTNFAALFQKKALLLAEIYNQQSITALSNMFGDCVMIVSTILLIRWNAPQFTILKSFLIESFYSFNDAIKCFYIILITDFLVGFHSPRGWEIAMEMLLRHLGLPEDEEFILLFVGTFPVFLDTAFKYWIFRYLNKISPSTVATYHSMIE